jgi:hypothetical protein
VLVLLALTKTSSAGRGRSLIVFAYTSSTSSKWVKFVVGSFSTCSLVKPKPGQKLGQITALTAQVFGQPTESFGRTDVPHTPPGHGWCAIGVPSGQAPNCQ